MRGMTEDIKFLRDVRIPMNDGVTLSAALRLPSGHGKFPCILDMIPYRWRDGIALRDKSMFDPLSARGFACLRLDVRGSGESGGIMDDEYTERQVQDMLDAIDWVIKQPWSDGSTGVMGNSWGGFSALGALKKGHPALKAGIVSCASDDGHTDDAHFESGVVLSENFVWGIHFTTLAAMPSDPDLAAARGEDWMGAWKKRLEALKPFPSHWIKKRGDSKYAEVRNFRSLDDAKVPVLLVGGWFDPYSRGQWRLGQKLAAHSKIILGGQAHAYPSRARKDLSMDFIPMAANWFRRHLQGSGEELGDAAWVFTRKIPTAQDPRASGWWIGLSDRSRSEDVTLPAPECISSPTQKGGMTETFGKWCPGYGGSEFDGYATDPAPDAPRSWIYKFAPFTTSDIFIGAPRIEVKHPDAFAGGVYLLRLFVNRKEFGLRRIGYAVIDGRTGQVDNIEFAPFGWQADPGDHLEIHVLPQGFPLLWAPYADKPLPKDLFGALSLPQPASWREANIKPAPDAPVPSEKPSVLSGNVEVQDGWRIMRVDTPFEEMVMPDGMTSGDSMTQVYEYGPSGEMKARFNCRYTLNWPNRREGMSVSTDIAAESSGNGLKCSTIVIAMHGDTVVFKKEFNEDLPDALLPPKYA